MNGSAETGQARSFRRAVEDHGARLLAVAERCRAVTADHLGVDLPEPRLVIEFVDPGEQVVHHDGGNGIRIAVAGLHAFAPPPAGANLVYAVCHEVGHLVVLHARGDGRAPGVVWDEALAHLLAVERFLPGVPDELAPAGSAGDWRRAEIDAGASAAEVGVTTSLARCGAALRGLVPAGEERRLVGALGRVPPDRLRADRFLGALREALGSIPAGGSARDQAAADELGEVELPR